ARLAGQDVGVHQRGADLRQLALARVGEARHQEVGHGERQHGVAEELELLVVGRVDAEGAMGERHGEVLGPREAVAETGLERRARSASVAGGTRPSSFAAVVPLRTEYGKTWK